MDVLDGSGLGDWDSCMDAVTSGMAGAWMDVGDSGGSGMEGVWMDVGGVGEEGSLNSGLLVRSGLGVHATSTASGFDGAGGCGNDDVDVSTASAAGGATSTAKSGVSDESLIRCAGMYVLVFKEHSSKDVSAKHHSNCPENSRDLSTESKKDREG